MDPYKQRPFLNGNGRFISQLALLWTSPPTGLVFLWTPFVATGGLVAWCLGDSQLAHMVPDILTHMSAFALHVANQLLPDEIVGCIAAQSLNE